MAQISPLEADSLLSKLLTERIPLKAFFKAPFVEVQIPGFIDGKTAEDGVLISESGPPIDVRHGFLRVSGFERRCDFWYGEQREVSEEVRKIASARDVGESVLVIRFLDTDEVLALYFTI
jgi:hypothetical protein